MKVCTAHAPRSGTKKAMTRCPPKDARMGSFGPTGPRLVTYSSAKAGVMAIAKTNAPARLERSNWTIGIGLLSCQAPTNQGVLQCTINTAMQWQVCVAVRDSWSRCCPKAQCQLRVALETVANDRFDDLRPR